jgi:hypothetical protein
LGITLGMKLLFNWLIRCGAGKWDSSARKRHALHWSLGDGLKDEADQILSLSVAQKRLL